MSKKNRAKDVAAYILKKCGNMSHMKLQKLMYYAQAWSLVWDEEPLFPERIEAWVNGPVVRPLYADLRLTYTVSEGDLPGADPDRLSRTQRETVDAVLEHYAHHDAQWLSDLTHMEDPWQEARRGMAPQERGETEITHASMSEYYSGIQ